MDDKCTNRNPNPQKTMAGISKKDGNIEFFGIRETREVKFFQNGEIHDFSELTRNGLGNIAVQIAKFYEQDIPAKKIIRNLEGPDGNKIKLSYKRELEIYVYYCWGSLNSVPDVINDVLQKPENFRETINCKSLGFKNKKLCIDGKPLKPREITMIDLFAKDYKDEVIAKELGISMPTFNHHKRTLFDKAGGVMTKTALMIKAVKQQLIPKL